MGFIISFLLLIIIPIALGLVCYFGPKSFGYPRVGNYITIGYVLFIIRFLFNDYFYTKKEALNLVKEQSLNLKEDFDLIKYKSAFILDDYYNTCELKVSYKDKNIITKQIINSNGFKKLGDTTLMNLKIGFERNLKEGTKIIQNYETKDYYVREFYVAKEPLYAPIYKRISVHKTKDKLYFEEF